MTTVAKDSQSDRSIVLLSKLLLPKQNSARQVRLSERSCKVSFAASTEKRLKNC